MKVPFLDLKAQYLSIRDEIEAALKNVLEKTKVGLQKIGEETSVFAKRGEKELSKIARIGKVEMDIVGLSVKKNQLYYQLGKRVHELSMQRKLTVRNLKKLCDQISAVDKNLRTKKRSVTRYLKKRR